MAHTTGNYERLMMQAPGLTGGLRLNRRGDWLLVLEDPCLHGLQVGADLGRERHLVKHVFLQIDAWRNLYQFKAVVLNPEHRSFRDQQGLLVSCCNASANPVSDVL